MTYIMAVALVSIALYTDIKTFKVKNSVNVIFALAGVLYGQTLQHILGLVCPLILFPLFALRMMGAGDIKLFCALGAIIGMPDIIKVAAWALALNGVIAIVLLLIRKNGRERLNHLMGYFWDCITIKSFLPYTQFSADNSGLFRYTYGIAASVYIYFALNIVG